MKWLLIFLLLIPTVQSFECALCSAIDSLDAEDPMYWKANTLVDDVSVANHSIVYNWNTALDLVDPPEGMTLVDSVLVKDVWVTLASVMPSVFFNGTLMVPSEVTVLSSYGFDYELQSDLPQESPTNTNSYGDCRTRFSLVNVEDEFNLYVDDSLVSHEKLTEVTLDDDAIITAELVASVDVNVEHYRWKRYCASW